MRRSLALAVTLVLASCGGGSPRADGSAADCCAVTIRAVVPEGTGTVYLAGNIPQLGPWRPDTFAMEGSGRERVARLTVPRGTQLEYKFTLGSWDSEALNDSGTAPPNNRLQVDGDVEASHEIRILVCHNLDKDYVGARISLGEGAMGRVAQTGEPLIVRAAITSCW